MKYIRRFFNLNNAIIKNIDLPSCADCVYIECTNTATNTHTFKCKKFGSKHIITGKIENEFALICRTDSDMCGKKGIHFIKKDANANSEKQGSSVIWYHPDE